MNTLLILLFALTLVYFTITERFRTYASLVGMQGVMLFGISWLSLGQMSTGNLLFIFSETIIFKTIIVPWLLFRIIERTGSSRVHKFALPGYYSIILLSGLLILSYVIAYLIRHPFVERIYVTVSLFAIFTGLLLIITHRKIFSHLVGFLVIENGVFLFSLSIGNDMPMLINTGILLDIFISVLIMGAFATRMGHTMQSLEKEELSQLKD